VAIGTIIFGDEKYTPAITHCYWKWPLVINGGDFFRIFVPYSLSFSPLLLLSPSLLYSIFISISDFVTHIRSTLKSSLWYQHLQNRIFCHLTLLLETSTPL
jgi:hypothetical protein